MFNITFNDVKNTSHGKVQECCNSLDIFFRDADSDVITISDTVLCVVNAIFSIVAVFSNLIVLYALYKATSLNSTSKALLCSLAISDLGVGAIVQPLFVAYRWIQIRGNLPDACTVGIISHIVASHLSAVSFLSLIHISEPTRPY